MWTLASEGRSSGRRAPRVLWAALALATIATLAPRRAAATPDEERRNAARNIGREAIRFYDLGNWARAQELFHRAYDLHPAPTLALREARALVKLGRLVEAAESYARATTPPPGELPTDAFLEAAAEAEAELKVLRPRIPRLLVTFASVANTDVAVRMNGVVLPRALLGVERSVDPGTYRFNVSETTTEAPAEVIVLQEGEARTVVLQPSAISRRPAVVAPGPAVSGGTSPLWTLGWMSVGVGVVALNVGVATGIAAVQKSNDLDAVCPNGQCPASAQGDLDSLRTLSAASTVGFVAAGIGVGVGGAMLLASPAGRAPTSQGSITPWIGVGTAGLTGTF
jgi:hypothetical protein